MKTTTLTSASLWLYVSRLLFQGTIFLKELLSWLVLQFLANIYFVTSAAAAADQLDRTSLLTDLIKRLREIQCPLIRLSNITNTKGANKKVEKLSKKKEIESIVDAIDIVLSQKS